MSIDITFCGATQTVTGSCYAITTSSSRFLIDCGLFQGSKTLKELNYKPFPFHPRDIDFVLLTHAHIDHSGLLPRLIKEGFKGPIYTSAGTVDLCSFMLPDSGHIQEMEVQSLNRRNQRMGRKNVDPIYTAQDAIRTLDQFKAIDLNHWFNPSHDIRVRLWNAGHILGSASLELEIAQDDKPLRLMFSGDIGSDELLLEKRADAAQGFDYVICESTYGATIRTKISQEQRRAHLAHIIHDAKAKGGALLIPAFAVERTQELLTDLTTLAAEGAIEHVPIFLDSPLAIKVTDVFSKHASDLLSDKAFDQAVHSDLVHICESVEESRNIEKVHGFHIIISASGMCDAGRIRHHLRHWLWSPKATVLLVGYQAQGTLGRILRDGAQSVRIFGDEIKVHATIKELDDYSGHADQEQLTSWIQARSPVTGALFLTHGEDQTMALFAKSLQSSGFDKPIITPEMDDHYQLNATTFKQIDATSSKRLSNTQLGYHDWHNDFSKLLLDMRDALDKKADDKSRATLIRSLRRALEQ